MRTVSLIGRSLAYYWRTNLAVVVGVAVAVAVLAGALLVGESVRASLRELFLARLGRADVVVSSGAFFREQLAEDVRRDAEFSAAGFGAACPLVALSGALAHEATGRRAAGVQVYGADARFWEFHGVGGAGALAPRDDEVLLSPALAEEFGAREGDALLLRVETQSAIPADSLHGRKEDVGRTVRLTVRGALEGHALGEFSVRPQQSAVRAAFVNLRSLQKELEQEGKVNTILISAGDEAAKQTERLHAILRRSFVLEDLGVKLRALEGREELALETDGALINDSLAEAAREAAQVAGARAAPVLSYLANSIRVGERETPYSLVTAVDEETFGRLKAGARVNADDGAGDDSSIILNEWAAEDLNAQPGDALTLEYYLWQESGGLVTKSAEFRVAGVVPVEGLAADRDLVPDYPGITEAKSVAEWDPPFPVELSRIRPRDEDYWNKYRTTPKAFVRLARAQQLWHSRFGKLTSMRVSPAEGVSGASALESYRRALRDAVDPARAGLSVFNVRAEGLEASRGATDFGEYFLYFSFFLVASALLLAALFFRLGVEQRAREIGLLRAVGFPPAAVRRIFLAEGVALALFGSLLGFAGAYAYGALMLTGLRTWWVGAVGTTALSLHVSSTPFVLGGAGGVLAALVCVVLTLRGLGRASPRGLLAGALEKERGTEGETESVASLRTFRLALSASLLSLYFPAAFGLAGLALLLSAALGWVGQAAGFFGGGTLLLIALLGLQSAWLRRRTGSLIGGNGWRSVAHLGARNATHRPGRSVLCITLIASAAFIVVAVDSFRRGDEAGALGRKSGSGGFALLAESLLPVVHDPNTPEGRDALNLSASTQDSDALAGVSFAPFRLRPGDDASCLNLYRPRQPRLLAPTGDFLRSNRFAFQSSLAATAEEKENPWLLLEKKFDDGAIPVAADANSMTYVLRLKLGEDFLLERGAGAEPLRLRLVAALSDSVFQGELLMSEQNFLRLFPEQEGYRFFLLDLPSPERGAAVSGFLEERLSDFGFDAVTTSERLANFHRVENTYLSTFQMLGGLGLALGTLGLAAVLLRNVLERRRELALLRAVGYDRTHFALMVVAENALLLFSGLLTGTLCALLAIAPVVSARGGQFPFTSVGWLLLAVVVSGLAASLLATVAALRSPLLASLRAE